MKKLMAGLAAVCLGGAMLAFAACGGAGATEEEKFDKAKSSFSNYTVQVQMGDIGTCSLKIADDKAEYQLSTSYFSSTSFFKKENGKVYAFETSNNTWSETTKTTFEETVDYYSEYQCGFSAFSQLYFDDLTKSDDSYVMTDNALASFSDLIGYKIVSFRLKMDGAHFASATAIAEVDGRMELKYTFSDYGSTSVTLPA